MMYSKTKIDKCVKVISGDGNSNDERKDAHNAFDYWRKLHIEPLTEITLKLQEWFLSEYKGEIYIAQRLKRKPQILRKLRRFSTRLTQLQDIGGCRVIVDSNSDVDSVKKIIEEKNKRSHYFEIINYADYRVKGRDDSGYRALHIIVKRKKVYIEIQIRSRIQHYWAESIERTSVISGRRLKELDGPIKVLKYFKHLSDVLYCLEQGQKIKERNKRFIGTLREESENIIKELDTYQVLDYFVNEQFIQSMIGKEKSLSKSKINNWMIIFDWKKGQFLHWIHLDKNPANAIERYSENEEKWPESEGYEVVLISSSSVYTIQETHNHYFGIESYEEILDSIDQASYRLRKKKDLNTDDVKILEKLYVHKMIGSRRVSLDTIKNHYCQRIKNVEKELTFLIEKDYIHKDYTKNLYRLNQEKIPEIKRIIGAY